MQRPEFFPKGGEGRNPLLAELGLVATTVFLGNILLPPVLRYLHERRNAPRPNASAFSGTWSTLEFPSELTNTHPPESLTN